MIRLLQELQKAGYQVDQVIPDGKWHRFKIDPKDDKKSGYYKAFSHFAQKTNQPYYIMIYGSWRDGNPEVYNTMAGINLDRHEKARIQEQLRKAQRELHLEKLDLQEKAAERANKIWSELIVNGDSNDSEYLRRKNIGELYGSRIRDGIVYVPMQDVEGRIWNLERIYPGGIKKGLFGGRRDGLFHELGEKSIHEAESIFLCEGFSTGVALNRIFNEKIIVSFNAANLPKAALEIAKKYPNKKYIICGDDDAHNEDNVGRKKALEAANAVGGKAVFPKFASMEGNPTDFDDLLAREGSEAVKNQILEIQPLVAPETYDVQTIVNLPYPDEPEGNSKQRKGTFLNIQELIRRLRIIVRYNAIKKRQEILIPDFGCIRDVAESAKISYILDWAERCNISVSHLEAHLNHLSGVNPYNPVATWIQSKPWDGVERLGQFYETIQASWDGHDFKLEALKITLMERWMISCVAAAFEPHGISASGVLVLVGKQSVGKTMWFKNLVPKDLGVTKDGVVLDTKNKDSKQQVISNWLVELGEIDGTFSRSEISALKAFLTEEVDVIRAPYAPKAHEFDRRTVFMASVNDSRFLKDPTGNRRFWTISCSKINYRHNIDMQQVWAEIYETKYLKGDPWHLTESELEDLNESNEDFQEISAIEELIRSHYNWENPGVTVKKSAAEVCQEIGYHKPSNSDSKKAADALRKITGKDFKKSNGRQVWDLPQVK